MTLAVSPHDPSSSSEERFGRREALLSRGGSSGRSPGGLKTDPPVARLRFDRFELDESEALLTCAGKPVALGPKPFAVLCTLARVPGRLVTKNALLDLVWGHRFFSESVKSTISELRAALDDDPKQPRYIETVSRRGYRFIALAVSSPAKSEAALEPKGPGGPSYPALEAITTLCRGDAALANLFRAVAAALERERLVLNEPGAEEMP